MRGGVRYFDETEREIVRAVSELARYGVGGRNLRVFRSSADREAQLLQSILAPALRSRNPERRKEAIEALENLAAVTTPPQAPAADPRPAQDRDLTRRRRDVDLRALRPRDPRLSRAPGSCSRTSLRCCWTRRRWTLRCRRSAAVHARWRSISSSLPKRAGSSSAARWPASSAPGFVPARKPGKLPRETVSAEYTLEYGIDALEVHADALAGGARVLVHDDLLATGGTARALCELVAGLGGEIVGCTFLIELGFLGGRERLVPHNVYSLIEYASERVDGRQANPNDRRPADRVWRCSKTRTTCRAGGPA